MPGKRSCADGKTKKAECRAGREKELAKKRQEEELFKSREIELNEKECNEKEG